MLKRLVINKDNNLRTGYKFVFKEKPETVLKEIETDIANYDKIGDYKEIGRLVLCKNKLIKLQSRDNGDRTVYYICTVYKWTDELIEQVKSFCKDKGMECTIVP